LNHHDSDATSVSPTRTQALLKNPEQQGLFVSEIKGYISSPAAFRPHAERLGVGELVFLAGLLMVLYAVTIDAVVVALGAIGNDLQVAANQGQLLITAMIAGMAVGQIFYGPVSDNIGRKPALYLALSIFAIGSIISMFASNFAIMIVGRVLQELGAGGARTITIALIRDQYQGAAMARIVSFMDALSVVMSILGTIAAQTALIVATWRAVFGGLLIVDLVAFGWLVIRQPETHLPARRTRFSIGLMASAAWAALSCRTAMGYTVALSLALGGWMGYLNSARQIFQDIYAVGPWFPFYFAVGGVSFATFAVLNARLVRTIPVKTLCYGGILTIGIVSAALSASSAWLGTPPLQVFLLYVFVLFSCLGLTFSNLISLAMEPLGQIAGVASGVISSISWLSGALLGMIIGQYFDGSLVPVTLGLTIVCALTLAVLRVVPAYSAPLD
jgi:DHA1 family bicyclomycin/chloramphenicol resistance-like MFS transporter